MVLIIIAQIFGLLAFIFNFASTQKDFGIIKIIVITNGALGLIYEHII